MRYVALFRGINVGGNSMISMRDLKAVFENAGMGSVATYINSGNVIFESDLGDRAALTQLLQAAVSDGIGLDPAILVRRADEIRDIAAAIPAAWTNDSTMRCDALYLWDEVDDPSVLDDLPFREGIDDALYVPGAVIHRVDRKDSTRSGLVRIVGTPLYRLVTVRNCNTARKLAELVS